MAILVIFWSIVGDIMANLGLTDFKIGFCIKVNVNTVCLFIPNTSIFPQFAILILVFPVSLNLLAAGVKYWVLYSFCGEILEFYLILRLFFHPSTPNFILNPSLGRTTPTPTPPSDESIPEVNYIYNKSKFFRTRLKKLW